MVYGLRFGTLQGQPWSITAGIPLKAGEDGKHSNLCFRCGSFRMYDGPSSVHVAGWQRPVY